MINGWVWFYDGAVSYITWSGFFRDKVNGGGGLKVDGTPNTLQIASTELDLGTFSFADIAGAGCALGLELIYTGWSSGI